MLAQRDVNYQECLDRIKELEDSLDETLNVKREL
jgi:hypothetical protein